MGPSLKRRREEFRMGLRFELRSVERRMASLRKMRSSTGERRSALLELCWIYSDGEVDLEVSS